MGGRLDGLWRHADFRKLWAGQTVSLLGSQVTLLALPLTAVLTLDATPVQMGILGALEYAPFLLVGLPAGAWVDRRRRRPILIGADLGRAVLLGSIPIAALLGLVRIEHLYLVACLFGVLTVFFDVAYQSFLPALVRREDLVEGNSKLEVSRSVAQIAGPGLGGALVQLITAPIALAIDAASFLVSALCLALVRTPEPTPALRDPRPGVWGEVGEGLRLVLGNPFLRAIAGCTATMNLFSYLQLAVFILYLSRELGIEPVLLGVVVAAVGPGALFGALLAGAAARRFGLGLTILAASLLGGLANWIVPLASGPLAAVTAMLIAARFLMGLFSPVYNVNQVSLRQAITPDRLQGRMNATMRFVVWGIIPIGSLLGGLLGEMIGLRPTLFVAAVGGQLGFLWLLLSPVRGLREQPRGSPEPA